MTTDTITLLIIRIVVSVVCSIVGLYLVPFLKSQIKEKQMDQILTIVDTAVQAAEQTLKSGAIKKADVLTFVSNWLGEKGLHISDEELDRLIESAVFAMNSAIKPSA